MSSLFSILESVIKSYKHLYDVDKYILFDKDSLQEDTLFWKELIYKCTNNRVSDKSVINLIDRLKTIRHTSSKHSTTSTKIIMSKSLNMLIDHNEQIKVKVSFEIKSPY